MQLKDLKIVVTGGAQGMGAHFAQRLQEAGAQVAVGDVNEERLAALPAGIHRRNQLARARGARAVVGRPETRVE